MKQIRRNTQARLTERDYIAQREQLLAKLEAVSRFADTDLSKEERIRKGKDDAFYFARTYLPHYFTTPGHPKFHQEIVDACQITEQAVVITGFRGAAKSTIVSFLEIIRDIVYQREDFVVLGMDSLDRAELYTDRILAELQHNARIKEDFGELVSMSAARGNFTTRRSKERPTRNRLMAWGDGMSMRGLVSEHSRPSKIVVEDLQDREAAESEKRTNKVLRILKADWMGALRANAWKFIVLGNVICDGSMIDRLFKEEPHWLKLKFAAETTDAHGNRVATWPEQFPIAKLDNMREQMGEQDYEAEMLCEPRERNAKFKQEWFRHWERLPIPHAKDHLFIVLDPSISETGDNKAMFPVLVHHHDIANADYSTLKDGKGELYTNNVYHFLLSAYNRQATVDDLIDTMYKWDETYSPKYFLVDGTFGQKKIWKKFLGFYAVKYGRRLKVEYYNLKTDKDGRVFAIEPDIKNGNVVFPPQAGDVEDDVRTTIRQFLRYGKTGSKKDGPDAIAAAIEHSEKKVQRKAKFHR